MRTTPARVLVALAFFALGAIPSMGGEIVFADGRREPVAEPRKDAKGEWTALREGRRTILRAGDVVAILDDAGAETVIIPEVLDSPDSPQTTAALAALRDPKNEAWIDAAERLGAQPTRTLHEALTALATDARKEMRRRAVTALARLHTREATTAAMRAVVAEKDAGLRRELASVLLSVEEILRRSDVKEPLAAGLSDKDAVVRVVFALLAPRDLAAANEVLRTDGLKNADHHVREDAAFELGRRGDGAGESILRELLARTRIPGLDTDDATMERVLVREQVEICGILGKLGTETAKAALRKATTSRLEAVRKAAEAALAPPPK